MCIWSCENCFKTDFKIVNTVYYLMTACNCACTLRVSSFCNRVSAKWHFLNYLWKHTSTEQYLEILFYDLHYHCLCSWMSCIMRHHFLLNIFLLRFYKLRTSCTVLLFFCWKILLQFILWHHIHWSLTVRYTGLYFDKDCMYFCSLDISECNFDKDEKRIRRPLKAPCH